MRKIGDIVTPKNFEELENRIVWIKQDITGEPLYILDNGMRCIENDLKPQL